MIKERMMVRGTLLSMLALLLLTPLVSAACSEIDAGRDLETVGTTTGPWYLTGTEGSWNDTCKSDGRLAEYVCYQGASDTEEKVYIFNIYCPYGYYCNSGACVVNSSTEAVTDCADGEDDDGQGDYDAYGACQDEAGFVYGCADQDDADDCERSCGTLGTYLDPDYDCDSLDDTSEEEEVGVACTDNTTCAPFICDTSAGICLTSCDDDEDCTSDAACGTEGDCVVCEDSDGASDVYTAGALVSGAWYTTSVPYENQLDYCDSDEAYIWEYYCTDVEGHSYAFYSKQGCGDGYRCADSDSGAYCFEACSSNTDCASTEECQSDGTCLDVDYCTEEHAECSDGVDNEDSADGLIDYPDDPECRSPLDTDESDDPECANNQNDDGDFDDGCDVDGCCSDESSETQTECEAVPATWYSADDDCDVAEDTESGAGASLAPALGAPALAPEQIKGVATILTIIGVVLVIIAVASYLYLRKKGAK